MELTEKLKEEKANPIEKIASFIVDKRNLFFLLYIFAIAFSLVATKWVKVENDITTYLPDTTETRQGLTVMNDQFTTYGTASVMLTNVTYGQAESMKNTLEGIDGVYEVVLDKTADHFVGSSALLSVTFDGVEDDPVSVAAMAKINEKLTGWDAYVETEVGKDDAADLQAEMVTIVAVAAIIIVLVLTLTSRTYAEVPVLIITFGVAALLNMGTNFLCGKISFISNSVTVVLQLALAIDYAIILCHRFSDEHETKQTREACIAALSKAIPEISSSSLTTISGLAALGFMEFGIGLDLAVVLIKAIILSLLSVFTLMPGLLMLFSPLMDRTRHRNLIPPITIVGKFAVLTRYVIPPIFVVVVAVTAVFANKCPYCYSYTDLTTPKSSISQITHWKIKNTFGVQNTLAVIVPAGNYPAEKEFLQEVERDPDVRSVTGLATVEAKNGYMLTDSLNPRQFSELAGVDYEVAQMLYAAYAVQEDQYGQVLKGVSGYNVPVFDMFMFLEDQMDKDNITLDSDVQGDLDDLFDQLDRAKAQLKTADYSRMVVNLNLPEESAETFKMVDKLNELAKRYFGSTGVYVVGNSTSDYDLSSSFGRDNIVISVLSALFVILILLFTFKSAGLPVLLIAVIQGSIWINFSFPYLESAPLYFLSYLIVNSIQMGANIDYAIVISSHYSELKTKMPPKEAIIATLNEAFPTIFTSGTILASAGTLIGFMTTNPVIAAIGSCLGRGTIVSMVLVLGVLPQIMLLGDTIIEKTSFELHGIARPNIGVNGTVYIHGRVHGYVNGILNAQVDGILIGEMNASLVTGSVEDRGTNSFGSRPELTEQSSAAEPEPPAPAPAQDPEQKEVQDHE